MVKSIELTMPIPILLYPSKTVILSLLGTLICCLEQMKYVPDGGTCRPTAAVWPQEQEEAMSNGNSIKPWPLSPRRMGGWGGAVEGKSGTDGGGWEAMRAFMDTEVT